MDRSVPTWMLPTFLFHRTSPCPAVPPFSVRPRSCYDTSHLAPKCQARPRLLCRHWARLERVRASKCRCGSSAIPQHKICKARLAMKSNISTAAAQLWRVAAGTELRRNVLETYGTRVLVLVVTFLTAVVIARELGPSGRGLFAVAATLGAIGAQFGNLGLHASNIYYVAKDRGLLPALIGNTLAVVFVACIVAALGGIGFAFWPNASPVHGTLLPLALASVPVGLAYLLTQGLLLGVDEVRAYNNIECGGKLLALMLMCILALGHAGTVELFFGATLSSVMVTFLWALLRLRRVSGEPPKLSWTVFRQSIGIGARAYTIAFFGFLLLRIDLLMVKYMLGATEAGYYSISQVLAENTMMFPVVVGLL